MLVCGAFTCEGPDNCKTKEPTYSLTLTDSSGKYIAPTKIYALGEKSASENLYDIQLSLNQDSVIYVVESELGIDSFKLNYNRTLMDDDGLSYCMNFTNILISSNSLSLICAPFGGFINEIDSSYTRCDYGSITLSY